MKNNKDYSNLPIERQQKQELGMVTKYKGGPTVLDFNPIRGKKKEDDKDKAIDLELAKTYDDYEKARNAELMKRLERKRLEVLNGRLTDEDVKRFKNQNIVDEDIIMFDEDTPERKKADKKDLDKMADFTNKYGEKMAQYIMFFKSKLDEGEDPRNVFAAFKAETGMDLSDFATDEDIRRLTGDR